MGQPPFAPQVLSHLPLLTALSLLSLCQRQRQLSRKEQNQLNLRYQLLHLLLLSTDGFQMRPSRATVFQAFLVLSVSLILLDSATINLLTKLSDSVKQKSCTDVLL